jgi:hypothetical protein
MPQRLMQCLLAGKWLAGKMATRVSWQQLNNTVCLPQGKKTFNNLDCP